MPYRGSFEESNAQNEPGVAKWLGFQTVAMTDVVDKSKDYPTMDMFLEISFRNKNSQYPTKYSLLGTYERDERGNVMGDSSLLKKVLYLCDALGWSGGVNTAGEWVDENDKLIDDIAGYFNVNFTQANYGLTDNDKHPLHIFVWEKWNEKAGKAYTTVCSKIVKDTPEGQRDLKSYVTWMKNNSYIVEHEESQASNSVLASGNLNGTDSTATAGVPDKF